MIGRREEEETLGMGRRKKDDKFDSGCCCSGTREEGKKTCMVYDGRSRSLVQKFLPSVSSNFPLPAASSTLWMAIRSKLRATATEAEENGLFESSGFFRYARSEEGK